MISVSLRVRTSYNVTKIQFLAFHILAIQSQQNFTHTMMIAVVTCAKSNRDSVAWISVIINESRMYQSLVKYSPADTQVFAYLIFTVEDDLEKREASLTMFWNNQSRCHRKHPAQMPVCMTFQQLQSAFFAAWKCLNCVRVCKMTYSKIAFKSIAQRFASLLKVIGKSSLLQKKIIIHSQSCPSQCGCASLYVCLLLSNQIRLIYGLIINWNSLFPLAITVIQFQPCGRPCPIYTSLHLLTVRANCRQQNFS